jgi:hypothetical protein
MSEDGTNLIPFTIESLNTISAHLFEHADTITNAARRDVAADLRLAARACDKFASLRFEVAEIAATTKDPDTARELRDALADAEARGALTYARTRLAARRHSGIRHTDNHQRDAHRPRRRNFPVVCAPSDAAAGSFKLARSLD